MPPKHNAFLAYVTSFGNKEIENGKKPLSLKTLIHKLKPTWDNMSDEEKNKYKNIANELNANQPSSEISVMPEIAKREADNLDYYKMKTYIVNLFELIPDQNDLLDKNFILLHINSHCHDAEQYYFPAEIAALEFNLRNGIARTYHQIIGISKIYPRGCAGGMREYSDKFHRISCWINHPDDYKNILLEFISFIKNKNIKDINQIINEDLPYIYTIETDIGFDMMKTKRSLDRLYTTAYPQNDEPNQIYKRVFNVGSLEVLFNEILSKMEVNQVVLLTRSLHDILENDMYGCGLGCMYHEIRDIAFKCSKARVLQWVSNICKYIHELSNLPIVPGKHMAIQLKNGSKMILENNEIPLSRLDLKCDGNDNVPASTK